MAFGIAIGCMPVAGAAPVRHSPLKRSDVVFMYQAAPEVYRQYGATVLGWGGTPTPQTLADAPGVRFFGSVGMVTEFARYHDRFPETYQAALCRDVNGQPVKVPWLIDHSHRGIPFWWCCTNQPQFRQFIRERVIETMRAGAAGLHIDDHLGTAGGLWLGICFCDRCNEGFRGHLAAMPAAERAALGVPDPATFDFRAAVRAWIGEGADRRATGHPLWGAFTAYQYRAAAAFMLELRTLAAEVAGRPVPVGANAGLLWAGHLSNHRAIDLFSAETYHHAARLRMPEEPILAYRKAEAVGKPYAATASGGDWAFVKARGCHGLVRGWIALSYAAGQMLMAPHRQWCHTPELGTHWYDGPAERFAPLYQFVRANAALFDDFTTHADVAVALPYRGFRRDPERWKRLGAELTSQGLSYSVLLGGDDIVDLALPVAGLRAARVVLAPDRDAFEPADRARLAARARRPGVVATVAEALAAVRPAVRVTAPGPVRAFPRVKRGAAVVHLVNWDYDARTDDFRAQQGVEVNLDMRALGVAGATSARWVAPGSAEVPLRIEGGRARVPELGLWGLLVIERARPPVARVTVNAVATRRAPPASTSPSGRPPRR